MKVQCCSALCVTPVPKGCFVTPIIMTLSSAFMVFRIFGKGFLNRLGSDYRREGKKEVCTKVWTTGRTHTHIDCDMHTLSVLGIFLTKVRSHSPMYTTEGGQALATFHRS